MNWSQTWEVLASAILNDYVPFITLLFSLYTISGGIRIVGDLPAHPLTNTMFLLVGGVLASIVGTTGAAMILIRRGLLETNAERRHVKHTVVFFIFVVCNCGGCLLPTGDPPLLLGYLRGVDFFWTLRLFREWLFVNGTLVAVYFALDYCWYYPRESTPTSPAMKRACTLCAVRGLWPNGVLLLAAIASVAMFDPSKALPGTDWHPWLYLREAAQLSLVALSLALGDGHMRRANNFNYGAIIEVAVLFFGIFILYAAAAPSVGDRGAAAGNDRALAILLGQRILVVGARQCPNLRGILRNGEGVHGNGGLRPAVAGVGEPLLLALSLGSVFMGANTYIGNGPNFMVKSVAEKSGVAMPSFLGYMLYALLFLVPLWVLTTFLFL